MKNFIPLIIAVILGLAAVFGVRHVLLRRESKNATMVAVVAAAQKLAVNAQLTDNLFIRKVVPRNAVPAKAVKWENREMLYKQRLLRVIPQGDYIQWSDVGASEGVSNLIGEGEWGVSVAFSDSAIASTLRPGDEIAIIGTFSASSENESIIVGAKSNARKKRITTTILPRVRIISISGESNSNIVLALSPEQAQLLIDAQRVASLYPVLRRPGDNTNIDRLKTGMVDSVTYDKLLSGQKRIEVPAIPDQDVR